MGAYWNTYAYCLLFNHFHLAICVKNQEEILGAGLQDFSLVSKTFLKEHSAYDLSLVDPALLSYGNLSNPLFLRKYMDDNALDIFLYQLAIWTVSERFRRFLLGYAKAINVQEKRHGSLFQKSFRRKLIKRGFSKSLVVYVHRNPIHHACWVNFDTYPWSSYQKLLEKSNNWLDNYTVLNGFGGDQAFQDYHKHKVEEWHETQALIIEEGST